MARTKSNPDTNVQDNNSAESMDDQTASTPVQPRVFAGQQEFIHDLFRLEPANMMRNVSYTERPEWVHVEHSHFYHSCDSNGRKLKTSSSVGGHFHEITIVEDKNGGVPQIKIGPPMYMASRRIRGEVVKQPEPVPYDQHTHDVSYVRSERIKPRKVNDEFIKFQMQKTMLEKNAMKDVKVGE